MRKLCGLVAVAVSLGLLGCAPQAIVQSDATGRVAPRISEVHTGTMPAVADWVAAVSLSGQVGLAYYDEKRRLVSFDTATAQEKRPFHPEGSKRASSGLLMGWIGDNTYIGFRDKEPDRDIFVGTPGGAGAPVGIGSETVALARMKAVSRANGLGVLWYGEPSIAEKKAYDIFYRELGPDGQPQGKAEALFEGIYPVMAETASGRLTAFTWAKSEGKDRILARTHTGQGSWSAVVPVADIAPLTPTFDAVAAGSRTWVFWHAQYGAQLDEFRLEGAYSDNGTSWSRFHVKGLDGLDIESASFAADGLGNVAVAAGVVAPGAYKKDKMRSVLVLSHDGGATWSAPVDLRQDPLQKDGKVYSHARAPKVEFLGDGRLLVAWEDWRSLRSAVHFSYSNDGGKTWLVSDRRLTPPSVEQERLALNAKSIFFHGKTVSMVVERFTGDDLKEKQLVLRRFGVEGLPGLVGEQGQASLPNPERLKARVIEFWTAMGQRDFEKTYAMMEPYFRSGVRYQIYKEKLGRIEYSNPEVKFTEIYGPLGLSVSKVTVEVKPIVVQRKTLKLDPESREIPSRWMWVDGDWYMEFNSEADEIRYTPF